MATSGLAFKVRRCEPELIRPAEPTPHEYKRLSDIDDQESLRFQIPVIQFYRHDPSMQGRDPVQAVRDGLARALVYYYPFAGRLKELEGKKLVVECTGEGVVFIEADADLRLEEFGDAIHPPFPCLEELLFDVPGSDGILDSPLLLIQVTRLKCGGFIFALRLNHTMSDGDGIVQFMNAVAEMARGATSPSVLPVWRRELLEARDMPIVTSAHHEYDHVHEVPGDKTEGLTVPLDPVIHRSFFFGLTEITAIRKSLPEHLRACTTFEVLTACLWRCRTIALQPGPEEETRVVCVVNARAKFEPPLPSGYYGNVLAFPAARATARDLTAKPIWYALELVRKAKAEATEEYMRSVAGLMVTKGRPVLAFRQAYLVSDVTRAGIEDVDYGWGKAVYGGPAKGGVGVVPGVASFYIPFRNREGKDGILVPICLPGPAMDRFEKALESILTGRREAAHPPKSASIRSAL